MLVWLLMLTSIMAVWVVLPDGLGEKKKKLIFLGLTFGIVVFVLSLRSSKLTISHDLNAYYSWYEQASQIPMEQYREYVAVEEGYLVLSKILAWFFPAAQFIYFFHAAFTTGVVLWYINRNTDDVFTGVIVYICFGPWQFYLTAFRQAIATCICLMALELIKKRKFYYDILAFLIVALASTIHTTAWMFLIVFILRYLKPGKQSVIFSLVTSGIMILMSDELVEYSNDTLSRNYTSGFYVGNVFGGLVPIIIYILALLLCFIVSRSDKSFVQEYSLEINMLILALFIYLLRYNTLIFERISFYFVGVIAVVVANAISRLKSKNEIFIIKAFCIAACLSLYIYRSVQQFGDYHFYWE